jgi:hypothetical protein
VILTHDHPGGGRLVHSQQLYDLPRRGLLVTSGSGIIRRRRGRPTPQVLTLSAQ